MAIKFRTVYAASLTLAGILNLSACAFHPTPLTEQEQIAKFDEFIAEGGYNASRRFEADTVTETWWYDGRSIDISLLAPKEPGQYPLIVYLPGLGEPVNAGRLWKEQWAKAGYAVFSVQPEDIAKAFAELKPIRPESERGEPPELEDSGQEQHSPGASDDRPRSERRRSSLAYERRYIGHEFFAAKALNKRIADLSWAYGLLRQRAQARQGLFARANLSKVIVAGYDIGAQTVSALIGEQTDQPLPEAKNIDPLAAILISPSTDAASGRFRERYGNIKLPFLAITSDSDDDPYAVTTPSLRRAIWDYASSESKTLLLLKHGDHRLLSGSGWSDNKHLQGGPWPGVEGLELRPDFANFQRDNGSRRRDGPPGGGVGRSGTPGHADQPMETHEQIAAIAGVTTAFLDSIAKKDNYAALWLKYKAQLWLESVAELREK